MSGIRCIPCEDPYDWEREVPWREKTLDIVDSMEFK